MTVRDVRWVSDPDDERIRVLQFAPRVSLRVEDIAAIANTMAQKIAELLNAPVRADVFPPVAVELEVWQSLCHEAFVYEICGEGADATLLCTRDVGRRITAHVFGEAEGSSGRLSALELRVLDRFMGELAGGLGPICTRTERAKSRSIYCELRLREPLEATVGIATCEPAPKVGPSLSERALEDCPLECSVHLGVGAVDIFTIAGLGIGDIVPLDAKVGESATLNLGQNVIAAGEGGVLGDRSAFRVHHIRSGVPLN